MNPCKGALAFNEDGELGLITSSQTQTIAYDEGNPQEGYVGILLTEKGGRIGGFWCSANPRVIAHLDQFQS